MTTPFGRASGTRYGTASTRIAADTTFEESYRAARRARDAAGQSIRIPGTKSSWAGRVARPRAGHRRRHLGLISSYIIFEARRLGAPRWLIARMAANTTLDTILGSIPLLGDMFDVAYKANLKNVNLLKRHAEKHGTVTAAPLRRRTPLAEQKLSSQPEKRDERFGEAGT